MREINYLIDGKEIVIGDNRVSFENEIVKVEDLGTMLILLTENTSTGKVNLQPLNNIFAVDENGNILWKIADLTNDNEYYQNILILINDDGEKVLSTTDAMGIRYLIRLRDLKILDQRAFK